MSLRKAQIDTTPASGHPSSSEEGYLGRRPRPSKARLNIFP